MRTTARPTTDTGYTETILQRLRHHYVEETLVPTTQERLSPELFCRLYYAIRTEGYEQSQVMDAEDSA